MLHVFWKGLFIGILIAAPMGPVGFLCVQRTLYKGRWHGFFSGLGSSISDFLYAIITCTGLGIVIHFIENNQVALQIFGSFLLLNFGIYMFFSNPFKDLKKTRVEIKSNSYSKDFLTVFLLSFSNPSILFFLIGLFNSFHFLLSETYWFFKIIGLICILSSNILWWLIVTYWVAKLRKILTIRKLLIIHKIMGILIAFFSFGAFLFFFFFK